MAKEYTIKTRKTYCRGNREDSISEYTGTIEYLSTRVFGYTLECGASWNNKINPEPKTIRSLVSNLQKSYEEKESCCYDRTYVEHVK